MVKIKPNVDCNNPIYDMPVLGPVVALVEGVVVRVVFSSALKCIQSIPLSIAWTFNIDEVTEIDYNSVIVSGIDLAYHKGFCGINRQMVEFYNYLSNSGNDILDTDGGEPNDGHTHQNIVGDVADGDL